ncbi:MAG: nitroreductase family protein [Chloroflexi bacterium]|nr:nitroreductase family protein [Chloroflexota bacterium]
MILSANILALSDLKIAQTDYPIHELLQKRWSPRAYAAQAVEPEKLRSVLEAARWSASGGNLQPWAFIIATKQDQPDAFARMVSCLMEGNVPWASQAPVLGIAVAKLLRNPEHPNRHAFHDVGLALQNLTLQATALDLYVHQMGGFSHAKAREVFAIPEDHEAVTMFTLGYIGDADSLPETVRARELATRVRRPLTEFVFTDQWGETSPLVLK